MSGYEWFRATIFLVATGNLGSVITVLVVYFWTWWRSPATQKRLPLHIRTIALSYIDMVAIVTWLIWARIAGFEVSTGIVGIAFGVGALVGFYSMVTIAKRQLDRLAAGRGEEPGEAGPAEEEAQG